MRFFLPILFLLGAVALFFGFIDPTYSEVKQLRTTGELYNDALDKAAELQFARDSVLDQYQSIDTANVERLGKLMPDTVDNVRLVRDIDNIARRYGMTARDVKVNVVESRNNENAGISGSVYSFETLNIEFAVTGSYEVMQLFLRDLERSLRLLDVVGINFKTTVTGNYDFTIALHTYWLAQ